MAALADLQRPDRVQHDAALGRVELAQRDQQFDPAGSTARQLLCFPISAVRMGITATGGSVVSRLSPQVKSMPMSTEKKKNDSDAVPWACHGVGPSSVGRCRCPHTPTPNTLHRECRRDRDDEVERRELDQRVEAGVPSTDRAEKPKKYSAWVPNWTVLVVTAK